MSKKKHKNRGTSNLSAVSNNRSALSDSELLKMFARELMRVKTYNLWCIYKGKYPWLVANAICKRKEFARCIQLYVHCFNALQQTDSLLFKIVCW